MSASAPYGLRRCAYRSITLNVSRSTQYRSPSMHDGAISLGDSARYLGLVSQRVHRIDRKRPAVVPWIPLKELFGWQYSLMIDFKRVFEVTLGQVHACVPWCSLPY